MWFRVKIATDVLFATCNNTYFCTKFLFVSMEGKFLKIREQLQKNKETF